VAWWLLVGRFWACWGVLAVLASVGQVGR